MATHAELLKRWSRKLEKWEDEGRDIEAGVLRFCLAGIEFLPVERTPEEKESMELISQVAGVIKKDKYLMKKVKESLCE